MFNHNQWRITIIYYTWFIVYYWLITWSFIDHFNRESTTWLQCYSIDGEPNQNLFIITSCFVWLIAGSGRPSASIKGVLPRRKFHRSVRRLRRVDKSHRDRPGWSTWRRRSWCRRSHTIRNWNGQGITFYPWWWFNGCFASPIDLSFNSFNLLLISKIESIELDKVKDELMISPLISGFHQYSLRY